MRVALVTHVAAEEERGSVVSLLARPVEELGADLLGLGHEVTVVHARRPTSRQGRYDGPSLEAIDRRTREGAAAAAAPGLAVRSCTRRRDLLEALDPERVDVVLAVGRCAGEMLERLAPELAVPWVWGPGPDDLRSDPGRVGAWIPRHAARFVVASLPEVDLLARAGVARDRCDVVPWQLATPGRLTRLMGEVPEDATMALTTAGAGGAGVSDVIRAVAVLPEMRLCVAVDEVSAADGHVVDRWARLAGGLRAGDRVRFVRIGSGESLRVLVRSSDLVVSAPHGRPESSVLATAMWAGTPVVASDVPGVRELVESGSTGLILPTGQPRRLARALRVVGRDAPARSAWAWAAHRRATERFDREGTAVVMALALDAARSDVRCGGERVERDRLDDAAAG